MHRKRILSWSKQCCKYYQRFKSTVSYCKRLDDNFELETVIFKLNTHSGKLPLLYCTVLDVLCLENNSPAQKEHIVKSTININ